MRDKNLFWELLELDSAELRIYYGFCVIYYIDVDSCKTVMETFEFSSFEVIQLLAGKLDIKIQS